VSEHVTVRGADRVAAGLRGLADDLRDMSGPGLDGARRIAQAAQGFAPHRTGRLAGSIRPAATAAVATVIAGAGIAYAGVIEGGWPRHNIAPARYLARATDANTEAVFDLYERAVERSTAQIKGV
jgi:hypothetical protein